MMTMLLETISIILRRASPQTQKAAQQVRVDFISFEVFLVRKLIVLAIFSAVACCYAQHAHPAKTTETIESMRDHFLGKFFVVQGTPFFYRTTSLGEDRWDETYDRQDIDAGTVIQLISIKNSSLDGIGNETPNAFGEASRSSTRNLFQLVFVDPSTKQTFSSHESLSVLKDAERGTKREIVMTTAMGDHAAKVPSLMPGLIGKYLYADRDSRVRTEESTLLSLEHGGGLVPEIDRDTYCCMKPLRILKAKYIEADDAVLLKLVSPDGKVFLALNTYVDNDRMLPFARFAGTLYASIPSTLSALDLKVLRHYRVAAGMSRKAVEMILGFADKENDYGIGGTQLVYDNGHKMIYLNSSDTVTNIQYFDY